MGCNGYGLMDLVVAIGKLCTEYNGHVFGVLLAILGSQVKANKAQAVKNKETDGKFDKNDLRFKEIEKDVTQTQGDIKEIRADVANIKDITNEINWKLEDKERYAKEEASKKEIHYKEAHG